VLGVRVRLAGGQLVRGGGKVVKNVAGYDLPKLFTGAEGRLGELLELTLRLHPLPEATCTVVTERCDPRPLEQLAPACIEYAWPDDRLLVRFESPAAGRAGGGGPWIWWVASCCWRRRLWDAHRRLQAGLEHICPPARGSRVQRLPPGDPDRRALGARLAVCRRRGAATIALAIEQRDQRFARERVRRSCSTPASTAASVCACPTTPCG
jgi:hypothetical protein